MVNLTSTRQPEKSLWSRHVTDPTVQGPMETVVVSGLVWQQSLGRTAGAFDPAIVGPAIGAALGVACAGASPELLISLPRDLDSEAVRFVSKLDSAGRLITPVSRPPLKWFSGAVRGEETSATFEGSPQEWPAPAAFVDLAGHMLVLANGNPLHHIELIARKPARMAMDIDAGWAFAHPHRINTCIKAASFVTVTAKDYKRLSSQVTLGTGLGKPGGPAVFVKRGGEGVILEHAGTRRQLPPPSLPHPVSNDTGAGDFLLGFIAAKVRQGAITIDALENAYVESLPYLAVLLTHESFHQFADFAVGSGFAR